MATFNELITAWGFEIKPEAARAMNQVQGSLTSFKESLETIGKQFTGGKSIDAFFTGFLSKSQELVNMSETLGISTESLQKWQYAATASGVSAKSVISDLETLRTEYRMNEKGVMRLADSFKKMSAGSAYFYGKMYGISSDTVLMLRKGADAIKEMQNRAPVLTDEELKRSADLNKKIEEFKTKIQKSAEIVVAKWVPGLTKVVDKFNEWNSANPEGVANAVNMISIALHGMAGAWVVGKIASIVGTFKSFAMVLMGNPIAATITAVAAAVAGLALDFQKFNSGGNSLIDWAPIIDGAKEVKQLFTDIWQKLWDIVAAETPVTKALKGMWDYLKNDLGDTVWRGVQTAGASMLSALDWAVNDRTWKGIQMRGDAIQSIWNDKQWRDPYSVIASQFQTPFPGNQASNANITGTTINIITSQPTEQVLKDTQQYLIETGQTAFGVKNIQ